MSDETPSNSLGFLKNLEGVDLTTFDPSYPVLEKGKVLWNISKATVTPTKDEQGKLLVLELTTVNPQKSSQGKDVQPGYKLTHRIGLTPTFDKSSGEAKRTNDMIFRDIVTLLDAVYGEAGRKAIDLGTFDLANLVNQNVDTITRIEPEQNGFSEKTSIGRFIRKEVAA